MPTKFCDCDECNYLDQFPIDHKLNKNYKRDIDVYNTMLDSGFTDLVIFNIIKKKNSLKLCHYCQDTKIKLCQDHYNRALKNGIQYRGQNGKAMCDKCCWDEIS
jgi:hypothetical protein